MSEANAVESSAMLEAAKVAESKAWHKLQLEEQRIGDEIENLRGEVQRLRDDWSKKYSEVNRLNRLHSSNTPVDGSRSDPV